MKKALTVCFATTFIVAMCATTWAQETQPSLSDSTAQITAESTVEGSVVMAEPQVMPEPMPVTYAQPMMNSNCGCQSMQMMPMTVAPIQSYAPMQSYSAPMVNMNMGCNSGMVGQVVYQQTIPQTQNQTAPIVTTAPYPSATPASVVSQPTTTYTQPQPTATYTQPQPIYTSQPSPGCCGATSTYAPQTTYSQASSVVSSPMTSTTNSYIPQQTSFMPQQQTAGCSNCGTMTYQQPQMMNTCNNCDQPRRGLFRRIGRR